MTVRHGGPPLLCVPGAFTGGWIWNTQFVPYFETAGFAAEAVTLPSHAAAGWRRQRIGIEALVDHLVETISARPQPPVIVAHSLGGFIACEAARRVPVAALALLSPIPPDGLLRSALALARQSPVSVAKLMALAVDARVARYGAPPIGIYSSTCDPVLADAITGQLRGESFRVLAQVLKPRRTPAPPSAPLHFFGAEGDHIIPAAEVRRAAQTYGAPVTIYPGMSHTFQAEADWATVAGDIVRWLETLGLAPGRQRARVARRA